MKKIFNFTTIPLFLILAVPFSLAAAPSPLGSEKNPIVMIFDEYGEVAKLEAFSKNLTKLLEQKTGLNFKYNIGASYAPSVEAMGANKAQMGWLNPFSYIVASKKYGVQLGLIVVREKSDFVNGEILIKKASDIKTLADLKGKTYSVTPNTITGYIGGYLLLKANGIDPDKDFKKINSTRGHRFSVVDVYKGDADVASVFVDARTHRKPDIPKDFPDILEKVIVLAYTPNIPNEAIAFTKDFPADLKAKIVQALLDIAGTQEEAKILSAHPFEDGVEGFSKHSDSYYNDLRFLFNKSGVDPVKFVPKGPPRS